MKGNLQSDLFRNLHVIRKACRIPLAREHKFASCVWWRNGNSEWKYVIIFHILRLKIVTGCCKETNSTHLMYDEVQRAFLISFPRNICCDFRTGVW